MEKIIIDYSQNGEQQIILDYFKDKKGTFLDIGANDGVTFSNVYALALSGWHGVCVEPTDGAFNKLVENYKGMQVQLLQYCVGNESKMVDFYEPADTLVATAVHSEISKWERNCGMVFQKVHKQMITIQKLMELSHYKQFDFISIDVEGIDFEILKEIDLTHVSMVCVEVNGNDRKPFAEYMERFGLQLIKDNDINIIYAKL